MPSSKVFDLRRLPFGLRRYRSGEFQRVHAAGSGIITASNVAALFGQSRFASRFSYMAHLLGRAAIEIPDSELLRRGRMFEAPALAMMAEDAGWPETVHLGSRAHSYARHPAISRFIASPDALAWDDQRHEVLIGEVKIVGELQYERDWLDTGQPPIDIWLQHQAQYACCPGATRGFIGVLVIGSFRADPIIYPTERHERTVRHIESAVLETLAAVERGELPHADPSAHTMAALREMYPQIDPDKVVSFQTPGPELEEAEAMFLRWGQARAAVRIAKEAEEGARAYFVTRGPDAALFRVGNQYEVRANRFAVSAKVVPATHATRYQLIDLTEQAERATQDRRPTPPPDQRLADLPRVDPKATPPGPSKDELRRAPSVF